MASGLKGVDAMRQKLRALVKKFPHAVERALYQEAQIDMTESKKRCPVDRGTLRASGHVLKPEREGTMVSVDMVYGGAAETYAIIQHEELDFLLTVGQAKSLESVILETAPHLRNRVAARIQITEDMLR